MLTDKHVLLFRPPQVGVITCHGDQVAKAVCQTTVRPARTEQPPSNGLSWIKESELTKDIYAGIEFQAGSTDCERFNHIFCVAFPDRAKKVRFPKTSGFGIQPASAEGTSRLLKAAIQYAVDNDRKSVTLVHKGNIMKFTEGAFRSWGYKLAEREFPDQTYTWDQWERTRAGKGSKDANKEQEDALARGKILVKDAIADITLQQVLTRPAEFDVIGR